MTGPIQAPQAKRALMLIRERPQAVQHIDKEISKLVQARDAELGITTGHSRYGAAGTAVQEWASRRLRRRLGMRTTRKPRYIKYAGFALDNGPDMLRWRGPSKYLQGFIDGKLAVTVLVPDNNHETQGTTTAFPESGSLRLNVRFATLEHLAERIDVFAKAVLAFHDTLEAAG
jgi:hypothetical protein